MASLASHELEGALKHGARVAEGAASGGVGDGNVEELGRRRRRRRLLRHVVPYLVLVGMRRRRRRRGF
jgi:hypothetical protein